MTESSKRKGSPGNGIDGRVRKRSKGGSGGRWQTPHQRAKATSTSHHNGGKIEPGDIGIWATCVKGKEGMATEELKGLFEEYAEKLYDIVGPNGNPMEVEEEDADIESSIQKEIGSMAKKQESLFTPVYLDVQCVLFFKTRPPIVPVDFVRRICGDAGSHETKTRMRFVNRLTPMTMTAKATEKGLEDVGKTVLREHFQLADDRSHVDSGRQKEHCSYAIRPSIRNHNTLKRDAVINRVASLIGPNHKVDLTKPEKVIIVEVYQTICGMSVIAGDWDSLKRYNLAEIYQQTSKSSADFSGTKEAKAKTGRVSKNEPQDVADDRTKQ